jgi:hypothetical protein
VAKPSGRVSLVLAVSLAASLHTSVVTQTPGAFATATMVTQLLDSAFPEWQGKRIGIRLLGSEPIPGAMSVTAWDTMDEPKGTVTERLNQLWIRGSIRVDQAGLYSVSFSGRAVHEWEMTRLTRDLNSAEATEDRAAATLASRGAKFPPGAREAFLTWLKKFDFSAVLGKTRGLSTEFVYRSPEALRTSHFMMWSVSVQDGHGVKYVLFFEPFEGRLTSIFRR